MHDQPKALDPALEDLQVERAVLAHVLETRAGALRLPDLTRELGDPDDFAARDRTERAVRDLVRAGLLFRGGGAVLPTRAALRAYELFNA
jgi:hypothetical protein